MIVPILLAIFGVTIQSIGYILQKIGITEYGSIRSFISHENFYKWLMGTIFTFFGTFLFFLALPLSSITLIQPLIGIGPAIVAVFGYLVLKTNLNRVELSGILLTILGIISLSFDSNPDPSILQINEIEFFYITLLMFFIVFLLTLVLVRLNIFDFGIEEGIIAGLFGGFSSVYAKIGLSYLFEFNLHWALFVLINTQIVAFILLQKALVGEGKVEKVISIFTGMSILVPVLIGISFFGEFLNLMNIIGILLIIVGSVVLTKQYSNLVI